MGRLLPTVLHDEPQFRLLFAGQALSVLGDRLTAVALPYAVLAVGGSISEVGLVAAAQMVPFLVLALVAGVVADRVDRRRVLIASDAVRFVVQLAAGLLLVAGEAEVWHLAALAAAFGAADAFFAPAITGLIPQTLLDGNHLQPANAMRSLSYSVGSMGGPVLAGLLIALDGPGLALLVDAGTFLVSIACLVPLRPGVAERDAEAEPSWLAGLRGGWREVRSRTWVWSFLAAMAVYHVVVLPSIFVLGPVLMDREYDGATSWAAIVTVFGIGSLLGDLLLLRWRPPRAVLAATLFMALASTQAVVIGSGLPIAAICALELIAAVGVTCFFTLWETSLQEHIPGHSISRVSSYDYLASGGLMPVGTAIAGPVAAAAGLHETLVAMSVIGVACSLALLAVPAIRTLPRAGAPGTA